MFYEESFLYSKNWLLSENKNSSLIKKICFLSFLVKNISFLLHSLIIIRWHFILKFFHFLDFSFTLVPFHSLFFLALSVFLFISLSRLFCLRMWRNVNVSNVFVMITLTINLRILWCDKKDINSHSWGNHYLLYHSTSNSSMLGHTVLGFKIS